MAQCVIDVFKVINIEKQAGNTRTDGFAAFNRTVQAVGCQQPVGKAGQPVILRKIMQFLFGLTDGGAVRNDGNKMGQFAVVVFNRDNLCRQGNRVTLNIAGFDVAVPMASVAQGMKQVLIKTG